jgi:hypothetical protein
MLHAASVDAGLINSLIAGDFDALPRPRIPGRNAPIVTSKVNEWTPVAGGAGVSGVILSLHHVATVKSTCDWRAPPLHLGRICCAGIYHHLQLCLATTPTFDTVLLCNYLS